MHLPPLPWERAGGEGVVMAKRIVIRFPADREYDYYTRIFFFAEDLRRNVVTPGLGTMNDIDRARNLLWIDLADKHNLGK